MRRPFEKRSFAQMLTRAVMLPLILMLALATGLIWEIGHLLESTQKVSHTEQVIERAHDLRLLVADLDLGVRSYLLSGDPSLLGPYQQAWGAVPPAFAELKRLVADDPQENGRVTALEQEFTRWNTWARSVVANGDWRNAKGQALPVVRVGETQIKPVLARLSQITASEEGLLASDLAASRGASQSAAVRGVLVTLFLGALLALFARRQLLRLSEQYQRSLHLQREHYLGLRQAQAELRQAYRRAKEAVQAREEFLSIASHELKTPLTSLRMQGHIFKRLMSQGVVIDRVRLERFSRNMDRQLGRLSELVEELLDVSKLHSGHLPMHLEEFALRGLVEEAVERLEEPLRAAGSQVQVLVAAELVVRWDRFRLEQVLLNLVGNAVKYAPGSPIIVRAKAQGANVEVAVIDQGMGIAPESHRRIFERYERAVSSRNVSGLGMGLYIARQIVEAHQGTIEVRSEPGHGATFTIRMPIRVQLPVNSENELRATAERRKSA